MHLSLCRSHPSLSLSRALILLDGSLSGNHKRQAYVKAVLSLPFSSLLFHSPRSDLSPAERQLCAALCQHGAEQSDALKGSLTHRLCRLM